MKQPLPVSRIFDGTYRLTRDGNRVVIEVLDYHAEPLVLDAERLEELGLGFRDSEPPAQPRRRARRRADVSEA